MEKNSLKKSQILKIIHQSFIIFSEKILSWNFRGKNAYTYNTNAEQNSTFGLIGNLSYKLTLQYNNSPSVGRKISKDTFLYYRILTITNKIIVSHSLQMQNVKIFIWMFNIKFKIYIKMFTIVIDFPF